MNLSESDVRATVRAAVKVAGSVKAWADMHGLHRQQVSRFLNGTRPPDPKILKALHLDRFWVYRNKCVDSDDAMSHKEASTEGNG